MAFVLNSLIRIGNWQFRGVHDVRINKSLRTYQDTAVIKLPAVCRTLSKDGKTVRDVETATRFSQGDEVVVQLGYNGDLREEFRGFVKRVNFNVPVEVECEGYSYLLSRNKCKKDWNPKTTTLSKVAAAIARDAGINVVLGQDADGPLVNFIPNPGTAMTCSEVLDYLLDKGLSNKLRAFFVQPDTLWIGLKYTAFKADVKYVLGRNVLRDNQLKERERSKTNVEIVLKHKEPTGKRHRGKAKDYNAKLNQTGSKKVKNMAHVADDGYLKKLASAGLEDQNYTGYEGKINAFLQPYCEPGYKALLVDNRYSVKGGGYVVEGIEVRYGRSGARRSVEIGLKVQ